MEELLRSWAKTAETDGEDAVMSDDLSPEEQLEELRRCVDVFRPRIEGNAWVQSLMVSL